MGNEGLHEHKVVFLQHIENCHHTQLHLFSFKCALHGPTLNNTLGTRAFHVQSLLLYFLFSQVLIIAAE